MTWTKGNSFHFLFLNFFSSLWEFNSRKNANIWKIERGGISAIKFEAARHYFLSNAFVAVDVVVAWRWCYMGRFATTIFSATQRCDIVTTLFQHCNALLRKTSSLRIVPCKITLSYLLIHGWQQTKRMILKNSFELRLLFFKWNDPLHCGTRGRPIHTGLRITVIVLFTSYDNVVMLLFAKCTLLSLYGN